MSDAETLGVLTLAQAAARAGYASAAALRWAIKRGQLDAIRIDERTWVVTPYALHAYLAKRRGGLHRKPRRRTTDAQISSDVEVVRKLEEHCKESTVW